MRRSVARTAQMSSATPTAGNNKINGTSGFFIRCWFHAPSATYEIGIAIEFQNSEITQANIAVCFDRLSTRPCAQSARDIQGESGLEALRASVACCCLRATIVAAISPKPIVSIAVEQMARGQTCVQLG